MTQEPVFFAIRDEHDYAAALDELDGLVLSEPGTPPGRRFDELVQLIDEYAARRSGRVPRRGVVSMTSPARIDTLRKLTTAANR
jgi:antitoxin component HigA of HigAB toxin-antitoxin module